MTPFQTQYNRANFPEKNEVNTQPHLTVPDQSLTVKQILVRHSHGLPLGGVRVPIYEGDEDILNGVDPRTLDLSERMDIAAEIADELNENKKDQDKKKKDKEKQSIIDEHEKNKPKPNTQDTEPGK